MEFLVFLKKKKRLVFLTCFLEWACFHVFWKKFILMTNKKTKKKENYNWHIRFNISRKQLFTFILPNILMRCLMLLQNLLKLVFQEIFFYFSKEICNSGFQILSDELWIEAFCEHLIIYLLCYNGIYFLFLQTLCN